MPDQPPPPASTTTPPEHEEPIAKNGRTLKVRFTEAMLNKLLENWQDTIKYGVAVPLLLLVGGAWVWNANVDRKAERARVAARDAAEDARIKAREESDRKESDARREERKNQSELFTRLVQGIEGHLGASDKRLTVADKRQEAFNEVATKFYGENNKLHTQQIDLLGQQIMESKGIRAEQKEASGMLVQSNQKVAKELIVASELADKKRDAYWKPASQREIEVGKKVDRIMEKMGVPPVPVPEPKKK